MIKGGTYLSPAWSIEHFSEDNRGIVASQDMETDEELIFVPRH
jgi:hypothetical protein